jgi:uncharacterized membrane protein
VTLISVINILARWLHVITACILIGCAFFVYFLLPFALCGLDPEPRAAAALRVRRPLKIVVHAGITLLLLTGAYNAVRNWNQYNQWPGVTHAIFGIHVLFGLAVMTLLLILLAGPAPRASGRMLMKWALILAFLTVLAASTLKWAREAVYPALWGIPASQDVR